MEEYIFEYSKVFHIVSVISWMAGLLYLPRIFVYHAQNPGKPELSAVFNVMQRRLFLYIMTPAMILTITFGSILVYYIGLSFVWLHIKLTCVFLMILFHFFLWSCHKKFANGQNTRSVKFYKMINEVPTVLMICILLLVILKPF